MATCEVCGETGTVNTVTIASAQVKACPDCANGTDDKPRPTGRRNGSNTASSTDPVTGPALARDYGDRVRAARENQGLSQSAMADRLNMKQSVLRRVENEELTPDRDLGRQLENKLDVTLYTDADTTGREPVSPGGSKSDAATLGDVANIKKTGD